MPIIGDDIKSQVGATITHRVMAKLFEDRGVVLDRTYQLNVGGNMDFKNMLERDRLESKKISKTQAVTSNLGHDLGERNVHIGPSDYVAWLDDRKWAYVRLEGRAFGDVPLNLEYKLEVWDSPNSAGIIIDAIRAAKIAKDRGIGGALLCASSYLMKSPPVQREDTEGRAGSRPSSPAPKSAEHRLTALVARGPHFGPVQATNARSCARRTASTRMDRTQSGAKITCSQANRSTTHPRATSSSTPAVARAAPGAVKRSSSASATMRSRNVGQVDLHGERHRGDFDLRRHAQGRGRPGRSPAAPTRTVRRVRAGVTGHACHASTAARRMAPAA